MFLGGGRVPQDKRFDCFHFSVWAATITCWTWGNQGGDTVVILTPVGFLTVPHCSVPVLEEALASPDPISLWPCSPSSETGEQGK